jgi:hypothetical protein
MAGTEIIRSCLSPSKKVGARWQSLSDRIRRRRLEREETSRSMRRFFIRREPPLAEPLPQENKTAASLIAPTFCFVPTQLK